MSDKYKALKRSQWLAEGGSPGSSAPMLNRPMLDDEDEPDMRDVEGYDDVLPPPPSKWGIFDWFSSALCCLCNPRGGVSNFREHWRQRSILTDWFVSWQSGFVNYCQDKQEVKKQYLHFIPEEEKAYYLYEKWCVGMKKNGFSIKQAIWKLTLQGMFKYGVQLAAVEILTIMAIYSIRLIIDFLGKTNGTPTTQEYAIYLFSGFCVTRILAIIIRNYYDLHVYNFFRFVQTPIQAWIYEDVQKLRLWNRIGTADHQRCLSEQKASKKDKKESDDEKERREQYIRDAEAQIINVMTNDISVFTDGSWCFPYLIVVPINTIISAFILYDMYGKIIIICYATMALLLVLQYWSNKKLAQLNYEKKAQTDKRIALVQNIIKGIKQVKIRMQENVYIQKISEVRSMEMTIYGRYVNLKQICTALYFNAGVIMSSAIFIFADPETLDLGKVFSTIALLGYVFNFSVLYSNYAIEALYTIVTFNKRIDNIILMSETYKNRVNSGNLTLDPKQNAQQDKQDQKKKITLISDEQNLQNFKHESNMGSAPFLKFDNVSAIWSPTEYIETQQPIIKNISFEFGKCEKVALIGRVGCGKSTLLNTILKEAYVREGQIEVKSGPILAAYAEQNPLIISGTVRSNITYGSKYDSVYYKQVITACQLLPDFESFPANDLTKTGEMGVTLSGGQRSRISLARALYKRNANIVLIDGALSSLDSRVSAEILTHIKEGELFKNKLVILVTYDLDQAEQMDWIIHMSDEGSIQASQSSQDFFTQSDSQTLQTIKQLIKLSKDDEQKTLSTAINDDEDEQQQDSNMRMKEEEEKNDETEKENKKELKQIIKDEEEEIDKVSYTAFFDYFSFCTKLLGGRCSVFIIIILHIMINMSVSSLSLYLGITLQNGNAGSERSLDQSLIIIMCATFAITVFGKFISCLIFMSINRNMHNKVMQSLINTKMAFFDENSSGAIINRLSSDFKETDMIVFNLLEMIDYTIKCLFSIAFIVISNPWTLFIVFFQLYYFGRLRTRILTITRDCFRLKQVLNAPVISLIQDSVNGQVTMRALGSQNYFLKQFFKYSDIQTRSFITSNGNNRYSAFRIDMQAFWIATIFAAICLFGPEPKTTSELALKAIGFQMAVEVARHFNTAVRWTFKIEMDLVAIQRLLRYANLEPEENVAASKAKGPQTKLKGEIEFDNVFMKYQDDLPPALKGLSFKIKAGQRVAVVGRTGAGKSTLFQLLQGFRDNCDGKILIDGQNILSLTKKQLRQSMNVVLQNPYFNENDTIRNNLLGIDQADLKRKQASNTPSDTELQHALMAASLDSIKLDDRASVLSGGQVQLLALAQAILNQNDCSILLLDEPTSHIDSKSQARVLESVFEAAKSKGQTVLMVAHRLDTAVTYCDQTMVLEQGKLNQFDDPLNLLVNSPEDLAITKTDSLFADKVRALTASQQEKILNICKQKKMAA